VSVHQELADSKNLTMGIEAIERIVSVDHKMSRKIILLLLDNAVKFTPEKGQITISAEMTPSLPQVEMSNNQSNSKEWLRISIEDNGPGIGSDDQERIFNLFEQADGGLDRNFEGTGLGLALAQSLAKALNGHISLRSNPGEGSTFTLVLPTTQ